MKNICFFLFFCFLTQGFLRPIYLYAEENKEKETSEKESIGKTEVTWIDNNEIKEPAQPFRVKNRKFEFGFFNFNFGIDNNYLSSKEVYKKKLILDIDKLKNGLALNFDFKMAPIFFNFNKNDDWGAGFSIGIETAGVFNISGEFLSLSDAGNDKSNVSGALFVEARYNGFFHIDKIKIKIRPALFYPLAYIAPGSSYSKIDTLGGTVLDIGYKTRIYTAWQSNYYYNLTAYPGLDLIFGIEYPLSEILGLKEKNSLLDFTIGLDLVNLPLVPAFMNNYMEISGSVVSGGSVDLLEDGIGGFAFSNDISYGMERKAVFRPFKFIPWIEWRPFKNIPLGFILPVGFMLSPYYNQIFSLEAGIKARFDLRNLFIATASIGYFDRLWKNSVDLVFNFRVFEIDLGVEMRSQSFKKIWAGTGSAVALALKFGW